MFYLISAWDREEAVQSLKNHKVGSFIGKYENYADAEFCRKMVNCTSYIISDEEIK